MRMPLVIALLVSPMLAVPSSAMASPGAGNSEIDAISSLDAASLSAWVAQQPPLMDHEELSAMLASPGAPALASFSNLPMVATGAAGDPDKWFIGVNLAMWTPGIAGDVGVGRYTADVNASFIDILDATDSILGITGAVRVSKGKFGGYVGGSFNRMGVETGPQGRVNVISTVAIVSFGVLFEAGRWPIESTATADAPARDLTLVLTAGGRYTGLDVDIEFPVLPDRHKSDSWVDPMIGAIVDVPLSQHFSIVGAGEIGGFGVASDFAWTASLVISWDFHIKQFPSSLQLGYLAIGDNYEKGSGADRFEWNTIMHGLLLNFRMQF